MTASIEAFGAVTAEVEATTGLTAVVDVILGPSTTVEMVGGIPGATGPPGPPGAVGPPGPPGTGAVSYTHVQSTPAAVWVISHNLGYQPNVTVIDSSNEQVEGDVIYGPIGTISVIFSGAFSGSAHLS